MYKVIKHFVDLQDNNYSYSVGEIYPREGLNVLPSRIKELSSKTNKQGVPLIEEVEEPKRKKSVDKEKETESSEE